jgi:hypothetical protein
VSGWSTGRLFSRVFEFIIITLSSLMQTITILNEPNKKKKIEIVRLAVLLYVIIYEKDVSAYALRCCVLVYIVLI